MGQKIEIEIPDWMIELKKIIKEAEKTKITGRNIKTSKRQIRCSKRRSKEIKRGIRGENARHSCSQCTYTLVDAGLPDGVPQSYVVWAGPSYGLHDQRNTDLRMSVAFFA